MEIPVLCIHKGQDNRVAVLNSSKGESAWTSGVVSDIIQALEETTLGRAWNLPQVRVCGSRLDMHLAGVTVAVLLQLQSKGATKLIAAPARLYDFTSVLQCVEEKETPQYHKL